MRGADCRQDTTGPLHANGSGGLGPSGNGLVHDPAGAVAELDDSLLGVVKEFLAFALQLHALLVQGEGLLEGKVSLLQDAHPVFELAEGLFEGTGPRWLGSALCLALCAHSFSAGVPHRWAGMARS